MISENIPAIGVRKLSKSYEARIVLRNIHLEVAEGDSIAFLGDNGSGKTTLLRCLVSVARPDAGEVRWYGHVAGANVAHRRMIGWVAHESHLYQHMTVRENLLFSARMCDVGRPDRQVDRLLESSGLGRYAHWPPNRVSEGMRRRISVLRALVHDPRIIVFDEPFSNLDASGVEWLSDVLTTLRNRCRTVCFATHNEEKSRRLANRRYLLRAGRLDELPAGPNANSAADWARRRIAA